MPIVGWDPGSFKGFRRRTAEKNGAGGNGFFCPLSGSVSVRLMEALSMIWQLCDWDRADALKGEPHLTPIWCPDLQGHDAGANHFPEMAQALERRGLAASGAKLNLVDWHLRSEKQRRRQPLNRSVLELWLARVRTLHEIVTKVPGVIGDNTRQHAEYSPIHLCLERQLCCSSV